MLCPPFFYLEIDEVKIRTYNSLVNFQMLRIRNYE